MTRGKPRSRLGPAALLVTVVALILGLPPLLLRQREARIERFCSAVSMGENVDAVAQRATQAGFSTESWRVEGESQRRLLNVGEEPFATLFTYCCVHAGSDMRVSTAGLCSSG